MGGNVSQTKSMPAVMRGVSAVLDQMVDSGIDYTTLAGQAGVLRELHVELERLYARCAHDLIHERLVAARGCLDFLEALIDSSRASPASIALLSAVLECQADEMSNNRVAQLAAAENVVRFRPHVSNGPANGPFGGDAA